ncbi:biotin transporter BioY [Azospirillum picis]|uniref:Biotin transporter n=1 Tax=Azospirillum picis TaxID=488438 RepID=A0ABU0MLT4_9PROT|nr:biotin transporter BioY [Azospirillum picis]MBP2300951.1 biotin transport system substrate-specific component [Azospirillum picis]MDQ0534429.1 biotin transport system substrate-specific component [Azospirillum picis]
MLSTRDLVLCALFAALLGGLGMAPPIPLGFLPVPITAQTLGVMLAGTILGARRGGLAALLFVLLVAAGLPLLAGGRGGIGVLMGPTGGFVLAWPLGAVITGWLAERFASGTSPVRLFAVSVVGGILAVYAVGIPWLALVAGLPIEKAALGTMAFLPGDLIKAGVCAFAAAAVRRAGILPLHA